MATDKGRGMWRLTRVGVQYVATDKGRGTVCGD